MKYSNSIHAKNKNIDENIFNLGADKHVGLRYVIGLIILVLLSLLYIEYKHPYFFLQDDNRDFFLPYYIHNYKSLLNGEIALYNFHQFLGIPHLAVGQSAVLYPITYLSVFLSDLLFGHYFATIEIQVIIHLLIGSIGFYEFLRFLKIDHKISFFGALIWPLSSFIIYVSNSWVVVSGVAAYFPWMLLFSFNLNISKSIKTTMYAVLVRLLLFYAGHIQYFIYSVIFEFITVTLYILSDSLQGERKVRVIKFIKKYIKGYFCVFILSLPLLLPMWHQTNISAMRSGKIPFGDFVSLYYPMNELLRDLFYPFSKFSEHSVWLYGNMFSISHIGYIPLIILILGIFEKIIKKQKNIKVNSFSLSVFVRSALIAFLWSTNWVFNLIIYAIPILNRFRWPFKIAVYLDAYLIIISMLILSNLFKQFSWKKSTMNILFCIMIGIQIFNFMFLYTATEFKALGYHGDKLPLEEKLQDKLYGGRIIALGFNKWSPSQENNQPYLTAPSLGFNYATLWGLDYFAGYEPLISSASLDACLGLNYFANINNGDPIPIDYLRKAAVCWYIIPKNKSNEYSTKFKDFGFIKKFEDENRIVFYDFEALPMLFNSLGEKIDSKDYLVKTNSIELNVDLQRSDSIIFNKLYNPFFEGYVDGKKVEIKPINDIHFSISIPEGKHHVLIIYKDPYFIAGTYFVISFFTVLIAFYIIKKLHISRFVHNFKI